MFNIAEEQVRLNMLLEENEGEITPELEELLAVNEANLYTKAANYRNAILNNKSIIEQAKAEKKRLEALIKTKERANDVMKERMKDAMNLFGMTRIDIDKGVGGSFSFRKSVSVVIEDGKEDEVPESFRNVTWTLDKNAIKEALNAGEVVEHASLEERQNLQIK